MRITIRFQNRSKSRRVP